MLISMTGHGHATRPFESGHVSAEIRAVNNRFLKVSARLDDATSALEPEIEALVRNVVRRGTLNVSVSFSSGAGSSQGSINADALEAYLKTASAVMQRVGWTLPVGDFLALPGVILSNTPTISAAESSENPLIAAARACLLAALDDLQLMRAREGESMAKQFLQTLQEFRTLIEQVREGSSRQVGEYQSRLEGKVRKSLEQLGTKFEASDIIREVTLFADRADICEEIVRFSSHVDQMQDLLAIEESPGRKMEFLIQELHREVNTIGSKSYDAQIAGTVIEIKAKIEQLRELVQNVE